MPIPDAKIIANKDSDVTEAEAAHQLRCELVTAACNALLAKQIECKTNCAACENKCAELQTWLDVGED